MGEQKREPRGGMVIEGLALALLIAVSVPPQADELASNLGGADDEGIAKVWSAQHHAQTFGTGVREPGYLVDSIELDAAAWTEDANVTVSVYSAWSESDGGPSGYLYTLENPTRGTGRKVFTVRAEDRVLLIKHQFHAIVIRNTGGEGSFNLNTTSMSQIDESDWRIENARWTTNPTDDLGRWVGATGAIKMRINDRDAPTPLAVAPASMRIFE